MLILSRKVNESIVIADRITIRILRIGRDSVKLRIEAPDNCRVHREEIVGLNEQEKEALKEARTAMDPGKASEKK